MKYDIDEAVSNATLTPDYAAFAADTDRVFADLHIAVAKPAKPSAPSLPVLNPGGTVTFTYAADEAESMTWRFDSMSTPRTLSNEDYGNLNTDYGSTAAQNIPGAEYLVLHLTVTNNGSYPVDPVNFASFGSWMIVSPGGQQASLDSQPDGDSVDQPVVNGNAYAGSSGGIQPGSSGPVTMLFVVPRAGSLALDSQWDGSTVLQINY